MQSSADIALLALLPHPTFVSTEHGIHVRRSPKDTTLNNAVTAIMNEP